MARLGGLKVANRRFERIRANRSHVTQITVFLQIDSRESPRFGLRIAGVGCFTSGVPSLVLQRR